MKSQREILGENLNNLLDRKKIDQKVLAEKVGVSEMTVSNWVRGLKYPRIDKIQAMADFFNIKKSDLIEEERPGNLYEIAPATVKIPIMGEIACGEPILVEENYEGFRYESPDLLPSGKLVYVKAKGDSMNPTIPNGSLVLIREQPNVESGEIAAVRLDNSHEITLKRVKKQGSHLLLVPDNSTYDPIVVNGETPVKIIGKAIRYTQDLD